MQTQTYPETAPRVRPERTGHVPNSYAVAVLRRQRAFLRGIAWRAFPLRRPVQHDFNCGSGRAIRMLYGLVRFAHGYDSSPGMLARARHTEVRAVLHEIAESGPPPQPATTETPAVVTAFRLLRQADPADRERPIAFAAQALPHYASGLLVVEHHESRDGTRRPRRRAHGAPREGSLDEVSRLLDRYGFAIVERRACALLPRSWYGHRGLRALARLIDDLACRVPALERFAHNVLYVARRVHAGTAAAD